MNDYNQLTRFNCIIPKGSVQKQHLTLHKLSACITIHLSYYIFMDNSTAHAGSGHGKLLFLHTLIQLWHAEEERHIRAKVYIYNPCTWQAQV